MSYTGHAKEISENSVDVWSMSGNPNDVEDISRIPVMSRNLTGFLTNSMPFRGFDPSLGASMCLALHLS